MIEAYGLKNLLLFISTYLSAIFFACKVSPKRDDALLHKFCNSPRTTLRAASRPVSPAQLLPEKMDASAAMANDSMTPGPATFLATIPDTRYMPVPTHDPTPSEVRSTVVRHFCRRKHEQLDR